MTSRRTHPQLTHQFVRVLSGTSDPVEALAISKGRDGSAVLWRYFSPDDGVLIISEGDDFRSEEEAQQVAFDRYGVRPSEWETFEGDPPTTLP